ncbi:hypothetical protein QMK17_18745 [Rhodococcus sp. G-MC3]|uniref:hypothetical protein n=1 Tax=Rhodococcus sp. G-MC3 TaxID=3046209 RepID=UPI0024BBC022|nr:hypothetical protein [Rhodococcus sp. G-MC3]MDJ0395365.1 hypothetical protein [Rhodococcus sp. G-MC3]
MDTQQPFAVGSHVKVRFSSNAELAREQWPKESGVIKEDFGDQVGSVDRTWAVSRRYAVALDDGRLVFADPQDIEQA